MPVVIHKYKTRLSSNTILPINYNMFDNDNDNDTQDDSDYDSDSDPDYKYETSSENDEKFTLNKIIHKRKNFNKRRKIYHRNDDNNESSFSIIMSANHNTNNNSLIDYLTNKANQVLLSKNYNQPEELDSNNDDVFDYIDTLKDKKSKSKSKKMSKKQCIELENKKTNNKINKEFSDLFNKKEKNLNNNFYFKKYLNLDEKTRIITQVKNLKDKSSNNKPYLFNLLDLDIPDNYKLIAMKKISLLEDMADNHIGGEYYKLKLWIDTFLKIPFNKYNNLTITYADNIDKCQEFIMDAKSKLDSVVFGLNDAKLQILQLIGLWLVNPNAIGCSIAIKGPMGTGKTTLIKEGVSKILQRPFAMIALGGCCNSGFLDGHEYVYEGSKYGKIIDILIQTQSMNPIILFDELDKVSDTPQGNEIIGVLTHLTDVTQNMCFADKYFTEIEIDVSRALYIFSYNNDNINPILKDRMYKIETQGYKIKEKITIAKDYLIPKISNQVKIEKDDIIFTNNIIEYIVNNYCENESGVRNLKRCIEIIYTKLNLCKLIKNDEKSIKEYFNLNNQISLPVTLNETHISNLLIKSNINSNPPFGMYT